jgi:3-hydroxy-9,10-secoandrosta-1,3,5(10)-triene-9,17-dione monooxygenase
MSAIARGFAQVSEMELALRDNFDAMMTQTQAGEAISMEQRAMNRYQSSTVVRRCADLINDIMPLLGGRAIYSSSPIVQPWLDLHAARAHVANDPGNMSGDVVNVLMGEAPAFLFL